MRFCKSQYFYRLILHSTRNGIYRVSGVAVNIRVTPGEEVLQAVPWDEKIGAIGYPEKDWDRLVLVIHPPEHDDTSSHDLFGYHVHNSCWELLTHHTMGETARHNLASVVRIRNLLFARAQERAAELALRVFVIQPDPANIKSIQSVIKRARIRTRVRFRIKGRINRRRNRLCYLPVEMLYPVVDYLSTDELESVQTAMKYYLGDAYWRARVPMKLFHEVRSVWDETLDWQFLCLKLERLSQTQDLAFRRYIIDQLDELQAFLSQAANE
ncbi:hypothetical protein BDV27DRAFT_154850 [Aspergillus caelatus]|uniref:Uncharacterized protein n=1 Tax=Aspergillus caelatus TaxID=61420 RepID=A0A5N7AFZ5_9EURO|nr:uncharacterized protein BDV27DRAFT_154850 [Aspergillus caelatus]KAE8367560.1 hypothetical protein BDV27DRAFT_154850 [Aspergillus caelatus]